MKNYRSRKNLILGVIVIAGFLIANSIEYPKDPIRPYLFLLGFVLAININLQYLFNLNMGATYFVATTEEPKARFRVLIASWLIVAVLIYGIFAW